jgi:hypothetical protein
VTSPGHPSEVGKTCAPPKLRGLTLKKARKRLERAGCKVGKVKRPKARNRRGRRLVVKKIGRLENGAVQLTLKWQRRR